MNEQQKRDEAFKILSVIYFEWGKEITEEIISYWATGMRGMSKAFAWKVASELIRRKTFGEPKFQDFWHLALELSRREKIRRLHNPRCIQKQLVRLLDIPGGIVEDEEGNIFSSPEAARRQHQQSVSDLTCDHANKLLAIAMGNRNEKRGLK